MGSFDLTSVSDFNKLVGGALAGLLGDLFNVPKKDPTIWEINESSYNGVIFHVFKSVKDSDGNKVTWQGAVDTVTDSCGRRNAKFEFPYEDGQYIDDIGRKPFNFEVSVILFGPNYWSAYTKLAAELNKPTAGDFLHPIRGVIRCKPDDWTVTHSCEKRQAVALHIKFAEANIKYVEVVKEEDNFKSVKGALSDAMAIFKKIDNAIATADSFLKGVATAKATLELYLNTYKAAVSNVLAVMNITFNLGSSSDLPLIVPYQLGGVRSPDGTITDNVFPVVISETDLYNIPQSLIGTQTQAALASEQIKKDIESTRAQLDTIIVYMKSLNIKVNTGASQTSYRSGALVFYDNIVEMKQTGILLQKVYEKGVTSSRAKLIKYTVPRDMSIREVAFENGVALERVQEIDLLNKELASVNFIPKGTIISMAVS